MTTAEEAENHFAKFLEAVETAYLAQKTGYDGKHRDKDVEDQIIQASLRDASDNIANACITLQHTRCRIRTAYFKIAILFYEALQSFKYAYMMSMVALDVKQHQKFFRGKAGEHKGAFNHETTVYFDIEELFDQFDGILGGVR